jgi:hypothetical protein
MMSTARWLRTGSVGLLLVVLLATAAGAAAPAGGSVSASDAGTVDIGVDAPETVSTDQSATATVTASGATGGVDVFELTLAASGSEATLEDVSVLTDGTAGPLTDIQYGPNDQTVTVRVTTLDATYENASTISLFDADVSNGENGTVDLAVTGVSTVQDTNLEPYTIGQTGGAKIEFTGDTQAPTDSINIPNKTIPADGGTITVSNQSAAAYLQLDTSELPEGWTVSDPQPIGFSFTQKESAWLYPVPETVSLNITPTNDSTGQSGVITATVDDSENQDTFTVTAGEGEVDDGPPASTPVPEDVASPAVVNAVVTAGSDDELGTLDILDGYAAYLDTGEVNGVTIDSSLTLLDLYSWRIENPGVEVGPVDPDGGTDDPNDTIGGPDGGNETDDELPDGNETDDGSNETDDDAPDDPDADEPTAASPLTIEQTLGAADADNSINAIAVAHGLTNGSAPVNLSEMKWTVTTPDGTTTLDYDDVQAQSAVGTSEPPLLESSGDVIQISFGLELNGLPPLEAGEDVTIEVNPSALDDDGGTPTESVSVTGTTPSSIQSGESYVL